MLQLWQLLTLGAVVDSVDVDSCVQEQFRQERSLFLLFGAVLCHHAVHKSSALNHSRYAYSLPFIHSQFRVHFQNYIFILLFFPGTMSIQFHPTSMAHHQLNLEEPKCSRQLTQNRHERTLVLSRLVIPHSKLHLCIYFAA